MKKLILAAGAVTGAVLLAILMTAPAQAQRGAAAPGTAPPPPRGGAPQTGTAQRGAAPARGSSAPQTVAYSGPRTPDKKPDLNGIWQALNAAHWNIEAHSAMEGVPAGLSVVEGG